MRNEIATAKERRDALSLAYQILTEDRNLKKYSMCGIRDTKTKELFEFGDMMRALRVMHREVEKQMKEESISRFDAVKKGLECYIAQMEGSCAKIPSCAGCIHYDRGSGSGLRACIDALELIQKFETIPFEWTSVKEKLPEPDSQCLIYTKVHYIPDHIDEPNYRYGIEISGFRAGIGFTSTNGLFAEFWMLLPDPPVQEVLHTVEHEDSKESEE